MVVSSVSPERWLRTDAYAKWWASSTASSVSVSVPIWLGLIRMALATSSSMPRWSRSVLVTNRSSPTSWTVSPTRSVSAAQPSQSFSSSASSMEMMGYSSTQPAQKSTISSDDTRRSGSDL